MRRPATIAALTAIVSSCMLLIDDPPDRVRDGAGGAGGEASGPSASCQERDYSCTCVVDGQQDAYWCTTGYCYACFIGMPHSFEVCCATEDWPNSGSCSCEAAGCRTDFSDDSCSCFKGSTSMESSCTDSFDYCGSSNSCEPENCGEGNECFCEDGIPVNSCEVAALGCDAGERRVSFCP